MALNEKKKGNYLSILGSDGTIRMVVPENTAGAVKRDYETSDGKTGTKYEKIFNSVSGLIKSIRFFDGDYGTQLSLIIKDGNESYILSVNTKSRYGSDLLKKLPNVDLEKEVELTPYSFRDGEKTLKGITIMQGTRKIENFFYDKTAKEFINKYPTTDKDWSSMSSDDKDAYGATTRKFLREYAEANIIPNLKDEAEDNFAESDVEETIDPADIPF